MANIVTTKMTFTYQNRSVKTKMTEQFDLFEWDAIDSISFYKAVYESDTMKNGEPVEEGDGQYFEDIGARWVKLDEASFYSKETELITFSAWHFPEVAFKQIYKMAAAIDNDVLASCTYVDESYNFIGAAAYGPGGYYRLELENEKLPTPPDAEKMSTAEYDVAYEEWKKEIENILSDLKKDCERKSFNSL